MELSTAAWMVHDTRLMLCVLLAIASIIVLISATNLPPFLSILIGTFIAGVGAGLPPEEVAKAIYFLCTDASSYVTGAELHINGGQHV